jgi:hypothetical protein
MVAAVVVVVGAVVAVVVVICAAAVVVVVLAALEHAPMNNIAVTNRAPGTRVDSLILGTL